MTAAHGTYARYVSHRDPCRCADCREAMRRYMVAYRARRRQVGRLREQPPDPTDGWLVSTGTGPAAHAAHAASPADLLATLHGASGQPCHVVYLGEAGTPSVTMGP